MWYWSWKKEVNQYYYDLERSEAMAAQAAE